MRLANIINKIEIVNHNAKEVVHINKMTTKPCKNQKVVCCSCHLSLLPSLQKVLIH